MAHLSPTPLEWNLPEDLGSPPRLVRYDHTFVNRRMPEDIGPSQGEGHSYDYDLPPQRKRVRPEPVRLRASQTVPEPVAHRMEPVDGDSEGSPQEFMYSDDLELTPPGEFVPVTGSVSIPAGFTWRTGPRSGCLVTAKEPEDAGTDDLAEDDESGAWPGYASSVPSQKKGSRRYCATLNTPSLAEYNLLVAFANKHAVYGVIAREMVSRPHLQIYLRFKDARTMSALRRHSCFKHCWIAPSRGTENQCRVYHVKGEHFDEFNPHLFAPGAGKRTDLDQLFKDIRDHGQAAVDALIQESPIVFARMHGGIKALMSESSKPRSLLSPPLVYWFWGEPGSGKTVRSMKKAKKYARELGTEVYEMNTLTYPWCPGLKKERVILMNEFRTKNSRMGVIPMAQWCTMWDVGACIMEIKGGEQHCYGEVFIVNCTQHPSTVYEDKPTDPIKQFLRRITKVIECRVSDTDPPVFSKSKAKKGLDPWQPVLADLLN
jgi:hypothetical protein